MEKNDDQMFRHKHLFIFIKFWDINNDGVLSWEDFSQLAEKYTKIQRRGQLDKEVLDRWIRIFEKWWNQLTSFADYNKDKFVEFEEWVKFFESLGTSTKTYEELPDFLQTYLHLFFLCMDSNKDGLFCVKDYKKFLLSYKMDVSRTDECFNHMLSEEDINNENALTSHRFKLLMHEFWTSKNPESKGKYLCGPFDSIPINELEKQIKHIA